MWVWEQPILPLWPSCWSQHVSHPFSISVANHENHFLMREKWISVDSITMENNFEVEDMLVFICRTSPVARANLFRPNSTSLRSLSSPQNTSPHTSFLHWDIHKTSCPPSHPVMCSPSNYMTGGRRKHMDRVGSGDKRNMLWVPYSHNPLPFSAFWCNH